MRHLAKIIIEEGFYYADLKQMRKDKGYTIRDLCKKIEMNPAEYSRIERGKLPIDEKLLKKIILNI